MLIAHGVVCNTKKGPRMGAFLIDDYFLYQSGELLIFCMVLKIINY